MNELIKITTSNINGAEVNSVNARTIHEYLEVKTPFSMWIDRAIKRYSFRDNKDFTTHTFVNGKATQIDFIISINMAKELCMVDNSTKGRETRKYFISIEEKSNIPLTYEQVMQNALLLADNKVKELSHKILEDKPLTDFGRAISQSNATVKIGDWIKAVNIAGEITMGRNKAFSWLRENGYLCKNNTPKQRYIEQGLFEVKEGLITTDVKSIATFTTLLTAKGQVYFMTKLKGAK